MRVESKVPKEPTMYRGALNTSSGGNASVSVGFSMSVRIDLFRASKTCASSWLGVPPTEGEAFQRTFGDNRQDDRVVVPGIGFPLDGVPRSGEPAR